MKRNQKNKMWGTWVWMKVHQRRAKMAVWSTGSGGGAEEVDGDAEEEVWGEGPLILDLVLGLELGTAKSDLISDVLFVRPPGDLLMVLLSVKRAMDIVNLGVVNWGGKKIKIPK